MAEKFPSAEPWLPPRATLPKLVTAAKRCEGCDLFRLATQTVFGEGPANARIVLVGEQPGDQEDLQGRPFVGPAGKLLDKALEEAGVDRGAVYLTNAVKHFKFEERGKRRIHAKPNAGEIAACRPWLQAEMKVLKPELMVCLGATAAQALLGREFRITKSHGQFFPHEWARLAMATVHPSAILRAPDAERRAQQYREFVADLALIPRKLAGART
jgi:uracil-DNA glycosylase family protein